MHATAPTSHTQPTAHCHHPPTHTCTASRHPCGLQGPPAAAAAAMLALAVNFAARKLDAHVRCGPSLLGAISSSPPCPRAPSPGPHTRSHTPPPPSPPPPGNAVDLLITERQVVTREVRGGYYSPSAYLLSKLTLDAREAAHLVPPLAACRFVAPAVPGWGSVLACPAYARLPCWLYAFAAGAARPSCSSPRWPPRPPHAPPGPAMHAVRPLPHSARYPPALHRRSSRVPQSCCACCPRCCTSSPSTTWPASRQPPPTPPRTASSWSPSHASWAP